MIRAICFDLDNTLWDVWPVIRRAEQVMYELLAQRYPRVVAAHTVESMREARERTAAAYPQMRHDFTFLRMQTLRDHAREFGYGEAMAEEAFEAFIRARNEVELYEDVLTGLDALRVHYRLFTASNGNADLSAIGLAHYFERSLAARQVGVLKPDPAIFHKVVEGTGLELAEVAYVGDDPQLDVEGARRAGMQAVWINRDGSPWPDALEPPAFTVRSLHELDRALAGPPQVSSVNP
jgi:FMN hydrolase / 5-amino-6-(5-phospho-D-ribitylamino)uracil phosphatase